MRQRRRQRRPDQFLSLMTVVVLVEDVHVRLEDGGQFGELSGLMNERRCVREGHLDVQGDHSG